MALSCKSGSEVPSIKVTHMLSVRTFPQQSAMTSLVTVLAKGLDCSLAHSIVIPASSKELCIPVVTFTKHKYCRVTMYAHGFITKILICIVMHYINVCSGNFDHCTKPEVLQPTGMCYLERKEGEKCRILQLGKMVSQPYR